MEHTDMRPKQQAQYVSLNDPMTTIEDYVDEMCQNMGEEHLRLHSVVPVNRGADTIGLWLFFTRVGETFHQET